MLPGRARDSSASAEPEVLGWGRDVGQQSSGGDDQTSCRYEYAKARGFRRRVERVRRRREARGWELVAVRRGLLRTTIRFRRPVTEPSTRRNGLSAARALLALLVGGAAILTFSTPMSLPSAGPGADSDGDGIPDAIEEAGWRTRTMGTFVTDPLNPDTDGDGLSDAREAGQLVDGDDQVVVYVGATNPLLVDTDDDGLSDRVEVGAAGEDGWRAYAVSDPRSADTDGDGIGDGDEILLDLSPVVADTDGDGLDDVDELDFGSDPTHANADGDDYTDLDEIDLEQNPLSYDLTSTQKLDAAEAGAMYGSCDSCALEAGLVLEQIESAEYLAGHVASGVAVVGDVRDVVLGLRELAFWEAGLSGTGLVPVLGDAAKTVKLLISFARRSDRAAIAVRAAVKKLALPDYFKGQVLEALPSGEGELPVELAGGPATYTVYMGADYVGITEDFAARRTQLAQGRPSFMIRPLEGATGLTRGQARSIQEFCIDRGGLANEEGRLQNRLHSIDPELTYAHAGLVHGKILLEELGGLCPLGNIPSA